MTNFFAKYSEKIFLCGLVTHLSSKLGKKYWKIDRKVPQESKDESEYDEGDGQQESSDAVDGEDEWDSWIREEHELYRPSVSEDEY